MRERRVRSGESDAHSDSTRAVLKESTAVQPTRVRGENQVFASFRSVQWNEVTMKARLMQRPRWDKGFMWWCVFHIYNSRKTKDGWVVGAKTKLFLWAREKTPAAAVFAKAERHSILQVTGRMKTAIWRRAKERVRTVGIDVFEAKDLGYWEFTSHRRLSRNAARAAAEVKRVRELQAAQLSREELEKKTEALLAEFDAEV